MRVFQAVVCAVAVGAATPGTDSAKLDTAAAPLLAGRQVGTFPQAVRPFGKPDRVGRVPGGRPMCSRSWRRHGLEMRFLTAAAGSCGSSDLRSWWQVTMRAVSWHTRLGLHVGDSEAKLSSLYPDARSLGFLGRGALRERGAGGPLGDGWPTLPLAGRAE